MRSAIRRPPHRTGSSGRQRPMAHPHRPARTVALGAVALLAGALAACSSGAAASSTPRNGPPNCSATAPRITVGASGQATAKPDTLTISLGIQVNEATAATALADANGQAATLTGSLRASGVGMGDTRSTDFSIVPTFTPSGRISGYQVSNVLLVTLHDLAGAGQVIDTAAASVGNAIRIDGLAFSVSNTGTVDGQARADAVATAGAHARSMARAAGESLGGVCSISDSTANPVPLAGVGFNAAASPDSPVPLEPGTQQASAQVTVVYALGPH